MRRLLVLLLLTSPSAALSQAAGQIFFGGSITSPVINAAKCSATNTTDTISLTWTIQLENSATWPFASGGRYQVFAASTDQGTAPPFCYTANGATWTAGPVTTTPTTPVATLASSSATVLKSALASSAGFNCKEDKTINVCVLWFQSTASGDTTPRGFAKGTVQLKVVPPDAPTVTGVEPGERALKVTISPAASGVAATKCRALAVAGADPGNHFSGEAGVADGKCVVRIEGLIIGVPYFVTAFAYSLDGNESVESCRYLATGAPLPPPSTCTGGVAVEPVRVADDWEYYKDVAQGRDDGGCDAGPAGLLALLGAAALLRLRRRS